MKTFKEECDEWLKPLGYTIHYHNGTDKFYSYHNIDINDSPNIECYIKGEEKMCSLKGGDLKYFMQIVALDFAFKHKDIEKIINIFRHYARICRLNPPF